MRTIIAPFRDEAYLLPFWLKHHREIFDHGVMIDHGSSDSSADIIRDLAPHWEIVPSFQDKWDPIDEDFERMTHEARFEGWKTTLNITEFLCAESLENVERRVEAEGLEGAHARGVLMSDPPDAPMPPLSSDEPLTHQRSFGRYEDEVSFSGFLRRHGVNIIQPLYGDAQGNVIRIRPARRFFLKRKPYFLYRARLYHRARHGAYHLGRHATRLEDLCAHPQNDMLCLHYYFSPWTKKMRRRAMSQDRFSERHLRLFAGTTHLRYPLNADRLEEERLRLARKSRDLSKDPVFHRNAIAPSERRAR